MVSLADELHVAVFDAIVDHLDEVAGAFGPDPVAAGRPIGDLGGDGLKDRLDGRPRVGIAAGHDRRAFQGPFFAPRYAGADKEQPFFLELAGAAGRVGEVRVAAVDQDVAGRQERHKLADDVVDGLPGLDHDHDLARRL